MQGSRTLMVSRPVPPRYGYTLAETALVIVLLGIFAGLAISKVNFAGFRADASGRQVRSTLQVAERLAVTRQYNVIVSFDTVKQTMRMVEDLNNNGVADSGERVTWYPLEQGTAFTTPPVGINGIVTQSVSGSGLQIIDGMPSLIFMRSGASSTDLEVYLTAINAVADSFRGITVTQSTGRTVYEKYIQGVWTAATI
jgi:Tfp pilus assembly protein FimT